MKPRLAYLLALVCLISSAAYSSHSAMLSDDEKLQTILEDLLEKTSSDLDNADQFRRDKKARPANSNDDDQKPLSSHGRKTFIAAPAQSPLSMCETSNNMIIETDKMLDSKASVTNGAVYLMVETIVQDTAGKASLNDLHKSCARACCENEDGCDTALLSLEAGRDGYRCYLFKCDERCIYVKHPKYAVLHSKSPEQQPDNLDKLSISTGQNQNNNIMSEDDMYGSSQSQNVDRLYFRDEDSNRLPMSGTTMAIVLLILGCGLVLSFFTYLILSTRFIRKKISWVGNNLPGQKNVDVDGDYLINGMYL